MPFICAFCKVEIQAGELVQPDTMMNLAHRSCIDRELKKIGSVTKPTTPLPPAPPTPLKVEAKLSGPGIGHPGALGEPCLMPTRSDVCIECRKPAISMCPACLARVHQNYGYDGGMACSTIHEAKCEGARKSRSLDPKPSEPKSAVYDYIIIPSGRNGKHRTQNPKRRKK